MSVAPTNWRKYALKLVGAGIGTAVAGPLGTALGGALGGLFNKQAEKLFEEYAGTVGEKLSEFGVHYCYDKLREIKQNPPLEGVLRESLYYALEEVRRGLDYDQREAYADWFENWASRLNDPERIEVDSLSDVVERLVPDALPADLNGTELALDQLFRRTMERLDGEARVQQMAKARGNLSITPSGGLPGDARSIGAIAHQPVAHTPQRPIQRFGRAPKVSWRVGCRGAGLSGLCALRIRGTSRQIGANRSADEADSGISGPAAQTPRGR
jgi:hypothetical protein